MTRMTPRPLLALALLATSLFAQDAAVDPLRPPASASERPVVSPEVSKNAVLRGINQVYLEVVLSDGAKSEDSDLRGELRDVIELELRRAGILLRDGSGTEPALRGAPTLRLEVKFDRGVGRSAARLNLGVSDQVTVTRNREVLLAEVWSLERNAASAVETGLPREIRQKARDMTIDFLSALRKSNTPR